MWQRILMRGARMAARTAAREARRAQRGNRRSGPREVGRYPGDFPGVPRMDYRPVDDGKPDPGEVVWAWVPFEEDHSQGKDRPVLVVGRDGPWVLGLPLTSKDHDFDEEQEAWAGRSWVDIGTGAWDHQGRDSEVRVNRVLRLDPASLRREGAALDRDRYEQVAAAVRQHAG